MVKITKLNYWKYRPDTLYTFFIDKKAATSGELLKSLEMRAPDLWAQVKQKCAKSQFCCGHSFMLGHFLFIVGREDYHHTYNPTIIDMILKSIFAQFDDQKTYKQIIFDCEDYPQIEQVIMDNAALTEKQILIANHCEWGNWHTGYDGED